MCSLAIPGQNARQKEAPANKESPEAARNCRAALSLGYSGGSRACSHTGLMPELLPSGGMDSAAELRGVPSPGVLKPSCKTFDSAEVACLDAIVEQLQLLDCVVCCMLPVRRDSTSAMPSSRLHAAVRFQQPCEL